MEDLEERRHRERVDGKLPVWYRVPSKGTSERQRMVADAVDEYSWQMFRGQRLKGESTITKMRLLAMWVEIHKGTDWQQRAQIQVENYMGALVRGGQVVKQGEKWVVIK